MISYLSTIHPISNKNSLSLSPGEWLNCTGLQMQVLGKFAHDIISNHFISKTNFSKSDYYFDNSSAGPIDRDLCNFIIKKNPKMTDWEKREIQKAVMKRPDILIHANNIFEFYEIKPDSISGMLEGDKVDTIALSMNYFNLPYKKGIFFIPEPIIPIGSIVKNRKKFDFHFITGLVKHGLITYRFCVSTDRNNNITFDKNNNVADYFREVVKKQTVLVF